MITPPTNETVNWNPAEKTIGVVGVAPAATADFYSKIIQSTHAKKDWEHAHVIIDSNPKIPSRGRYFELGETDPVPYIRQSIARLHQMGASIIALPCNTAHILYDRYTKDLPVAIPNMIEATKNTALQVCGKNLRSVAVFASRLTQQHRLYEKVFNHHSVSLLDTSTHQTEISSLIESVKQGESIENLSKKFCVLLSHYRSADAFILGCTELSLLTKDNFEGIPVIDSNLALAKTCLALSENKAFHTFP